MLMRLEVGDFVLQTRYHVETFRAWSFWSCVGDGLGEKEPCGEYRTPITDLVCLCIIPCASLARSISLRREPSSFR